MTEARAASGVVVTALIRAAGSRGGHAMVIARGDAIAGAILIQLADRGAGAGLRERVWRMTGGYALEPVGPVAEDGVAAADDYIARRRRSDPDLWVIEIDHPEAEAIAASIL